MTDGIGDQEVGARDIMEKLGKQGVAKPTILEQIVECLKYQLKENRECRLSDLIFPEGVKSGTAVSVMYVLRRAGIFQDTGSRGVWKAADGFEARSLVQILEIYRKQMNKERKKRREKKRDPVHAAAQAEELEPKPVLELSGEEVAEVIMQLPLEYLFSSLLQRTRQEIEKLEENIKNLEADNRDFTRQIAEKESDVLRVRQELVGVRTEVLHLRADLVRAQEPRGVLQAPDRIYAESRPVEGGGGMQSGGSGPAKGAFRGVQIHRRPLTGHVPATVQVIVKKKNGN